MSLLSRGPVLPLFLFAAAIIGCLLGLLCLDRGRRDRRRPQRFAWLFLGAWSIASTIIWDMYLLLAVERGSGDGGLRFALDATIVGGATTLIAVAAGLFLLVGAPHYRRIMLGAVVVGVAMTVGNFAALSAVRMNAPTQTSGVAALAIAAGTVLATLTAFGLSLRLHWRSAPFYASVVLALAITAAHYAGLQAQTVGDADERPIAGTIKPIAVLIPVAITLALRFAALLTVILSDTRSRGDHRQALARAAYRSL